jgi:FKBP-type peptidyl-prolyl cis-trans isomerase FklB
MKIKLFALLLGLSALTMVSCNKVGNVSLKTQADSAQYCIGTSIGRSFKSSGIDKINYDVLIKAIDQALKEEKFAIADDKAQMIVESYIQKLSSAKGEKNKKAGEEFLKNNKSKKGVVTTPSGLQYEIVKQGTGVTPKDTDMVEVHYNGTLIDGKVFDSSVQRGQPVTFPVNGVIKGWTEALKMMPVGSKWKLYIPSELGYGEQRAGKDIEPNSVLIFDVELLSIKKPEPKQDQQAMMEEAMKQAQKARK